MRPTRTSARAPFARIALLGLCAAAAGAAPAADLAPIPATRFRSVLPAGPGVDEVAVPAFELDVTPVTEGELAAFLERHPEWARDRVPRLFADAGYLAHWPSDRTPPPGWERRPATRVSWFAARAYCADRGLRLPTWHEWELAAAADETTPDARGDPTWRQRILDWYARPGGAPPDEVGRTPANFHGVRDLHGLVWEWVEDFGALMVSPDNREQGKDPDTSKFCGSGALTMEQKENYAVLMRLALLSSLRAETTTANLGFRCARSSPGDAP